MGEYIIEMQNITKAFPGVIANDNVTLQIRQGEVHALLGENGAGKSTLMSVLFGLYQPDNGVIKKNGNKVNIKNPNDANALNIGMVHQHFKLVDVFTVLENIILGAEPNNLGFLDSKLARKRVENLATKYGLNIDLDAYVSKISVGMQQRVEILKMLYRNNDVLIFDEPTAVLTPQEIEELIKIMKNFKNEGKSIVFITHKLNEIMAAADRCTVLRKGKHMGTVDIAETDKEQLSKMMVGRTVNFNIQKKDIKAKNAILKVNNLSVKDRKKNILSNVSFEVKSGEILCIAGIDGNGQTQLIKAITGLEKIHSGSVILNNKDITKKSIRQRAKTGVSHIPEDRHRHGLILDYSLEQNLVIKRYYESQFQRFGFIKFNNVRKYANKLIKKFDIRSGEGAATIVRSMSGGNQQKAIVAREIDNNLSLLIAVQPTRGLDIGAIEYIHKQIADYKDNLKAVLLVSLELDEVMDLSDRILVMYEGEIVGEFDPKSTTIEELGLYMAGGKRQKT